MITIIGSFIVGLLYANFIEVFAHKYFLHDLGKKKIFFLSIHWHRHHQLSRKNNMVDPDFSLPFYSKQRLPEVLSIFALLAFHIPLLWISWISIPAFAGIVLYFVAYYNIHNFCHQNPTNSKKWFTGHYFHHMGSNQDSNWGIIPLVDFIIGTSYLNRRKK